MSNHPPKKFRRTKGLKSKKRNLVDQVDYQTSQPVHKIHKVILDTLRYRQIFDCPMTFFQLWQYLIADFTPTHEDFKKELADLVTRKTIFHTNGQYSLGKIDHEKIEEQKNRSEKLLIRAKQVAKYLKQIPWIEMVAVTGSVSASNADEHADIDILVVTKPGRLFLSRLFLVSILKLLGVYRNAKKPAGTVCPNILMTSDKLAWNETNRNIYIANEISLLYPLFFRHNCYFDFLQQNDWVSGYLPNFRYSSVTGRSKGPRQPSPNIVGFFEQLAMKIQMLYMKNKKTMEVVSKDFIHFNIHDSTPTILQKFNKASVLPLDSCHSVR